MMRTMLKSRIHRATVTQADLHYVTNGARLETYVSSGVLVESEIRSHLPRVVHVDGANRIVELGADPAAPSPSVLGLVRGDAIAG